MLTGLPHLGQLEMLHLVKDVQASVLAKEVINDSGSELVEVINEDVNSLVQPLWIIPT